MTPPTTPRDVALPSFPPQVVLLEPEDGRIPRSRYFVAIGFGIVFLLAASILFGGTIAQSVVEEKQTRVIDLLISAIPARTLLAGKVIGNTILAMAQIPPIGLAAIAIVGLIVTGQGSRRGSRSADPGLVRRVLPLRVHPARVAVRRRRCDGVAPGGHRSPTTTPLTMLIMAPYFLVIFFNDNPTVLAIMSYVPFSAPVGMPMRLFLGEGAVVGADHSHSPSLIADLHRCDHRSARRSTRTRCCAPARA